MLISSCIRSMSLSMRHATASCASTRRWQPSSRNFTRARNVVVLAHQEELSCSVTLGGGKLNLKAKPLQVGGKNMMIVSPSDMDAVMDYYIDRGMQDKDPYWAIIWASAVAMAELLQKEPDLVRGRRVAEIGCGLGIAGTAAALAGAQEVVLMDREACSLQCALMTATASGVSAQSATLLATDESERTAIQAFEDACKARNPPAQSCQVTIAPFDWNLPFNDQAYDVVIACDVLYEDFSVAPLAGVIPSMLGRRTTAQSVLLTDPPNRAPENRKRFMAQLAEQDPDLVVRMNKIATPEFEGAKVDVQLIVMQRRTGGQTVGAPLSSVV